MNSNAKNRLKEIFAPVAPFLDEVDVEIKRSLFTGVPLVDEASLHLYRKGGKKIRAALVILCSALKDSKLPPRISELAASVEVVHAATLIHDDIIDHAQLRRGESTVSNKWGNKVAVLIGDYMYTKALNVPVELGRIDLYPVMVDATCGMVKGELCQIEFSSIDNITLERYYNIIEYKTARFLAACCELGARYSNMKESEIKALSGFGLELGYAFQIIDDILDFAGGELLSGKDEANDFLDGKVTLPFLFLLDFLDEKDKDTYLGYMRDPDIKNWEWIKDKIIDHDVVDRCIERAESHMKSALSNLEAFPDSEYKQVVVSLSDFLMNRSF